MNFKISDYEHIIDNFQSAIVIFDRDLNLLHINKAGKQLLNISNEISNLKDLFTFYLFQLLHQLNQHMKMHFQVSHQLLRLRLPQNQQWNLQV